MNILPLLALQTIYYANKHRRDSMTDEDYDWDDEDYDWDDEDYDWDD